MYADMHWSPLTTPMFSDHGSMYAEMANATFVPVDYILQRGQTVKCFSLLVKAMHSRGMICPDDWEFVEGETEAETEARSAEDGYEGATVLEPLCGAYFQPVVVLDFASLV